MIMCLQYCWFLLIYIVICFLSLSLSLLSLHLLSLDEWNINKGKTQIRRDIKAGIPVTSHIRREKYTFPLLIMDTNKKKSLVKYCLLLGTTFLPRPQSYLQLYESHIDLRWKRLLFYNQSMHIDILNLC